MREIARGAIERHLGDVAEKSPDSIYDEAMLLAMDALIDAGIVGAERQTAADVASSIARDYAQP
jgi:hypothetical protein